LRSLAPSRAGRRSRSAARREPARWATRPERPPRAGRRRASRASTRSSSSSCRGSLVASRSRLRAAWEKSFLERNQRVIGLVGVVALLAASGFALLLSGGVFARTYRVTAIFSDAAGIAPGDRVTVAGLPAGTVKAVRIQGGEVAMDLAVGRGVQLPADSRATVVVETLLGKRAVQLVAGPPGGRLRDGSVIPLDRTTTPVDITQLNDISVNLLQHSDARALDDFLAEVTKAT